MVVAARALFNVVLGFVFAGVCFCVAGALHTQPIQSRKPKVKVVFSQSTETFEFAGHLIPSPLARSAPPLSLSLLSEKVMDGEERVTDTDNVELTEEEEHMVKDIQQHLPKHVLDLPEKVGRSRERTIERTMKICRK